MSYQIIPPPYRDQSLVTSSTLYFAYGSNLSFHQMAKRCPESRFVGRARLHGYMFQINQRGFANIVKSSDPRLFVDGLCYLLKTNDERSLDRSEGVPTAYTKEMLEVEFFSAAPHLVGRDVKEIVRSGKFTRRSGMKINTSVKQFANPA